MDMDSWFHNILGKDDSDCSPDHPCSNILLVPCHLSRVQSSVPPALSGIPGMQAFCFYP